MRKIDLADASFLFLEKREIPMHVAGLLLCTLPEKASQQDFMQGIDRLFRNVDEFRQPFGEYVTTGKMGALGGLYWEKDRQLDFDYHIRHSALPKPGRYRELFSLVSRLHGTLLDRSRPLWEAHLIEGLQNRQFALYLKMHHAAIDGAAVDGIYPVNIPFDGMAMSITLISYNDKLDFGIVACRRAVPALQRMIDYLEEALFELEQMAA